MEVGEQQVHPGELMAPADEQVGGARSGNDEAGFLSVLDGIASSGRTPAEELLEAYDTRWGGSVDPVFEELRY